MSKGAVDKRETWGLTALGELGSLVRGVTYKKAQARANPAAGYLPLLRATNIGAGLSFEEPIYIPASVVKPDQRLVVGDVVIAMSSGSLKVVGKSAPLLDDWEGTFGAFCAVFRPGPSLLPGFISKILASPSYRSRISKLAAGSNINNLTRDHLLSMEIPVPSLDEQRRIVATLDETLGEIGELKRNRQAKRALALDLQQAALQRFRSRSLGNKITPDASASSLSAAGKWSGGGTPKKSNRDYWTGGTIPWITPKDMKSFTVAETQDHITTRGASESPATVRPAGSVAIVVRSGILRHSLPVAVVPVEASYNQDMKVITPPNSVDPRWLAWTIRASEGDILATCRKRGATVESISAGALRSFPIEIPNIETQRSLVRSIEKIFDSCEQIGRHGESANPDAQLDSLAASLMTQLLTAS